MKTSVYLVGPFIGELSWEYFNFAPYIINLKKKNLSEKFIIFTRKSRFDLYGSYSDILVPLRIKNDVSKCRTGFTITWFKQDEFNSLLTEFISKYKKRYKIIDKIYPDISDLLFKVKWQFPRSEMDYDFKPRKGNVILTKRFMKKDSVFIDNKYINPVKLNNYETKNSDDFATQVTNFTDNIQTTTLGCFIEAIKCSKFVVGNLLSDISRLAILLKKPLITVNETLTDDEIHLINPLKTPIIRCNDIEEGIKTYENNF